MHFPKQILYALLLVTIVGSPTLAQGWIWHLTQNAMSDQRWAPAYTLLPDSHTALIAGGYSFDNGGCVSTADVFDETTQRFLPCKGRLHLPRDFAVATLLADGTVLISGGFNDVLGSTNLAEIYHPSDKIFTVVTQHMLSPRELHTATLLRDGTVLIVGGLDLWERHTQNTAEIYDPATCTFISTSGNMTFDRFGQACCLLADGDVLVVGGTSVLFGHGGYAHVLASAEIYDPVTQLFRSTAADMTVGRDRPTANLLPDGTVLIEGGQGPNGESITYSEIYDPKTDAFTKVAEPQGVARMAHCCGELPDGKLIITGGWCAPIKATTNSVEEFDPPTNQFTTQSALPFSSHDAAQVVFSDGEVLVAGGKTVAATGAADGIDQAAWAKP
jgi:hypothetical protein